MTRLKHYDNLNTARFVTFGCYNNLPLLTDDREKEIFLKHLDNGRNVHNFKLLGYVLMPNHVHLVIWPSADLKLGLVIGEIKSLSAREILGLWQDQNRGILKELVNRRGEKNRHVFWKRRCYDHNCRTPDIVREKINYCHDNPVKKGLVESAGDWGWSSYNWYLGRKDGPIAIDEFGI
ncbi:conserved hypothetical protein [Candidatus Zixiibacteriota bacterium]|nr:conserved hypothetical protein [candidate division Zixibacteria bacterium]